MSNSGLKSLKKFSLRIGSTAFGSGLSFQIFAASVLGDGFVTVSHVLWTLVLVDVRDCLELRAL